MLSQTVPMRMLHSVDREEDVKTQEAMSNWPGNEPGVPENLGHPLPVQSIADSSVLPPAVSENRSSMAEGNPLQTL